MNKKQIIDWISAIGSFIIAVIFFFQWQPSNNLFQKEKPVVDVQTIQQNPTQNFIQELPADDIPRVQTASDLWNPEKSVSYYFTAEPVAVIPTKVYSLKEWADPYQKIKISRNSYKTGSPKKRALDHPLIVTDDYNQYYLLELADGSHILSQLPKEYVSAIKKGEKVTLPIGKSKVISDGSDKYLEEICQQYNTNSSYMLYCFNDNWYEKNSNFLFLIRIAAAFVLYLVLAATLMTIGQKMLKHQDQPIE